MKSNNMPTRVSLSAMSNIVWGKTRLKTGILRCKFVRVIIHGSQIFTEFHAYSCREEPYSLILRQTYVQDIYYDQLFRSQCYSTQRGPCEN